MKIRYLAYCETHPLFLNNQILDATHAKNFPGASWLPLLKSKLKKNKIELVTGDVAVLKVKKGQWLAKEIGLIYVGGSADFEFLKNKGAQSLLLFCAESPLWLPFFYDGIEKTKPQFKASVLFTNNPKALGNHRYMYFPAFFKNKIVRPIKWDRRQYTVLVASNKFSGKSSLKRFYMFLVSKSYRIAKKHELQTKRLEVIQYFGDLNQLSLFGSGWDRLSNLPFLWRQRIVSSIKKIKPTPIKDKIKCLSQHRFVFCFENTAYPGYITEKIIDALAAATIPIYAGSKDIAQFIPVECFINMAEFRNLQELDFYLKNLPESHALKILEAGQRFLKSPAGLKYSYENFAQDIYQLIKAKR